MVRWPDKYKVVFSIVIVALLYFHYPLMMALQHGAGLTGEFSINTGKGTFTYATDINWFFNDIKSLHHHPGLFIKDGVTFEHQLQPIPLQGSLPFLLGAIIYCIVKNPTATLLLLSITCTFIIIFLLFKYASLVRKKHGFKEKWLDYFLVVIFFTLPHIIFDIPRLFTGTEMFLPYTGMVNRFINTNQNVVFLLLWIIALYICIYDKKDSYWQYALLGASIVLMQYSYVFFWTGSLLFTGFALWFRNKLIINLRLIKKGLVVFGTWLILSIPYIYNYFKYLDFNKDFSIKAGSHVWLEIVQPFNFYLAALFVLCAVTSWICYKYNKELKKKFNWEEELYFEGAFFASMLVLLNLQWIVGFTVQPFHWVWAFAVPLANILLYNRLVEGYLLLEKMKPKLKKAFFIVIISLMVIFMLANTVKLYQSAHSWYDKYYFDESDKEFFKFIRENTASDDVFFSRAGYLNDVIAANTDRRVLLGFTLHSGMTHSEANQRLLQGYLALNLSREDLYQEIRNCNALENVPDSNYTRTCYLYYHYYYLVSEGVYNVSEVISDLKSSSPSNFKLNYLVYVTDLEVHAKDPKVVFKNAKYVVIKYR